MDNNSSTIINNNPSVRINVPKPLVIFSLHCYQVTAILCSTTIHPSNRPTNATSHLPYLFLLPSNPHLTLPLATLSQLYPLSGSLLPLVNTSHNSFPASTILCLYLTFVSLLLPVLLLCFFSIRLLSSSSRCILNYFYLFLTFSSLSSLLFYFHHAPSHPLHSLLLPYSLFLLLLPFTSPSLPPYSFYPCPSHIFPLPPSPSWSLAYTLSVLRPSPSLYTEYDKWKKGGSEISP